MTEKYSIGKGTFASSALGNHIPTVQPKPKITWAGVGIATVLWLIYSVFYTLLIIREGQHLFVHIFTGQLYHSAALGLYSIPVWLLLVRVLDKWRWRWKIVAHLVIAPLYAWVGFITIISITAMMTTEAIVNEITAVRQWLLYGNVTVYMIQFSLYHGVRFIQQLRWREQQAISLMMLAQEQELAALKAQVNPHFLFNTLNSISAMVSQKPEQACEMIADLAGMLRYALDSSKRDLVRLGEDLDFAQAYLALEGHRFPDRLKVQYDVSPEVLEALVPPMLLQPLVENAVKHGVAPDEKGGTVTLRIVGENGRLVVDVKDTGYDRGSDVYQVQNTTGIGLTNTEARLRHLFGEKFLFEAAPQKPHGFKVSFSIPQLRGPVPS